MTVVVYCEGKTESRFLTELRNYWKIPTVTIEVQGQCGDPSSLMKQARERAKAERAKAERDQAERDQAEVWAVFDRDEHHHWANAVDQAKSVGVRLAISNPCFELWALLLHEDQTANIHRRVAQRRLKKKHPNYCHNKNPFLDLGAVTERLDAARERSARINANAEKNNDTHENPSSTFCDLIDRMRALKDG